MSYIIISKDAGKQYVIHRKTCYILKKGEVSVLKKEFQYYEEALIFATEFRLRPVEACYWCCFWHYRETPPLP